MFCKECRLAGVQHVKCVTCRTLIGIEESRLRDLENLIECIHVGDVLVGLEDADMEINLDHTHVKVLREFFEHHQKLVRKAQWLESQLQSRRAG